MTLKPSAARSQALNDLFPGAGEFLPFLAQWQAGLEPLPLKKAAASPGGTAIISVDVINGFCYEGALASPRVARIIEPITHLFTAAWQAGVRHILLVQEAHDPQALEFSAWPPHCVRGTAEAQAVPAIKALPFYDQMVTLEKNSIQAALYTGLQAWIDAHTEVSTYIVVGDCTDLCTYQLAMHLRLDANARQLDRRVIVPANCTDTYDMPLETAQALGALPHPGDLLHALFLYHMALNGVEVVAQIEASE